MIAVNSWGKNIYIDKELSGFIAPSGDMYAKEGYKFGSLSDRGDIYINHEQTGYITDDYVIIINGVESGYVDIEGNVWFDSACLEKANHESSLF